MCANIHTRIHGKGFYLLSHPDSPGFPLYLEKSIHWIGTLLLKGKFIRSKSNRQFGKHLPKWKEKTVFLPLTVENGEGDLLYFLMYMTDDQT